ncbi:glycosyltransferase family protein [Neptunicella marina]|uniref:Spore protein YkvP/CgeB glycosyl transferase-like domain-containing protein n=1 Tax=Neptunicella marina TaxID=2125989 RepID=A0A8J6ISR8_9ALTE|nr:hypothetical protein [Neptunicella marina]MBC3764921.1 hypothetical protein [Neptunicella marina]
MKDFCIASPHKNVLWYDYRLYINLKEALTALGYQYRAASKNRIYFLGGPQRHFYPEVGKFDPSANNIALIYCHAEKLDNIKRFDKVFVCSEGVKLFLEQKRTQAEFKTSKQIDIIRPFSSLSPSNRTRPRYQCDVSFIGTPRVRPIVEAVLPIVEQNNLKFNIYGPNWDHYEGNPLAKSYWVARTVPYEEIPMLAKGSKICLIDHHNMMNKMGTVSHKYVDFVMAGAFVISDWNKDALGHYSGVCFENEDSLANIVQKYLGSDMQRIEQQRKQQEITQLQTTKGVAETLAEQFI